jgi:ketosteroid isomerase-like protein
MSAWAQVERPSESQTSRGAMLMSNLAAQTEIAAVMEAIRTGLRQKNAAAIVSQYSPDAVLFDLAPPLSHQVSEEDLRVWLSTWAGPVTQDVRITNTVIRDELACTYGLIRVQARTKKGEEAAWWMRFTAVLMRQSDAWKIVHEHTSVPFYMDGSDRAALDLSP